MFNVTVQIPDWDSGPGPLSPEQDLEKLRKYRPLSLPKQSRLLPVLKPRLLRLKRQLTWLQTLESQLCLKPPT